MKKLRNRQETLGGSELPPFLAKIAWTPIPDGGQEYGYDPLGNEGRMEPAASVE